MLRYREASEVQRIQQQHSLPVSSELPFKCAKGREECRKTKKSLYIN